MTLSVAILSDTVKMTSYNNVALEWGHIFPRLLLPWGIALALLYYQLYYYKCIHIYVQWYKYIVFAGYTDMLVLTVSK